MKDTLIIAPAGSAAYERALTLNRAAARLFATNFKPAVVS
jgi:hypothetical protein